MRVAFLARDDSATDCLGPLASSGCQVLGVVVKSKGSADEQPASSFFARRCIELGFDFSQLEDSALAKVVDAFAPDMVISSFGSGVPQASFFGASALASSPKKYVLQAAGVQATGEPHPEFMPLWLGEETSRVSVVAAGSCIELAGTDVAITTLDTALSLRAKHVAAACTLIETIVTAGIEAPEDGRELKTWTEKAPSNIGLEWDEDAVDRYVRASYFPPKAAAVAIDPNSQEGYYIESLEQYKVFRSMVFSRDSDGKDSASRAYAADTHWYSNVGGTIIRMSDADVHKPTKVADRKRKAIIPGAAISGRKKLRMNEPLIGPNAERYCAAALDSSWIGVEGPHVKRLEQHLSRICGCSSACAVHSGTAALYGAMKALGVSDPAHHVLVPAFTCAACADAVVHAGGVPVPIDCDMDSWGVSAEAVSAALDADKDIIGVVTAPCYGVPSRDFHEVLALCKDRGLWLCEDACESYGATQGGEVPTPVGSLATLCVVSIRSEKMIGVGEGGAILGNDATLVARAKWWCSRAPTRGVGLWRVYEHDAVGQNFRLPEVLACIGCAAAEMFPVMIERKRAIHGWYEAGFSSRPELKGISFQQVAQGDEAVWWITAALLPEGYNGEAVGMKLMEKYPDIEIRPGFFPLNKMAIFKSKWAKPCPNAEVLYQRLVCLPSSNQLKKEDVERICDALVDAIRG